MATLPCCIWILQFCRRYLVLVLLPYHLAHCGPCWMNLICHHWWILILDLCNQQDWRAPFKAWVDYFSSTCRHNNIIIRFMIIMMLQMNWNQLFSAWNCPTGNLVICNVSQCFTLGSWLSWAFCLWPWSFVLLLFTLILEWIKQDLTIFVCGRGK